MNKVYWSFGDLKKSSSFLTMNTLDISNTNFVKVKMNRLKKLFNSWKTYQKLDLQILYPKGNL